MRVVLIGGIGYVGGRLSQYLRANGHHVCITTRRPLRDVPSWVPADEVVQSNLIDESPLRAALSGRDMVVHLAAPDEIAAAKDPLAALRAGGELVWNTLATLEKTSPRPAYLFVSTFHVYGPHGHGTVGEEILPLSSHPYGLGHYLGENVTQVFRQQKKVDALCIRMANVFGAPISVDIPRWSLVFNDLCLQAVGHKKLVLKTAGTQRRNFITQHDAARAIEFMCLHRDKWPPDGIIHLGSPMNFTIREVARHVARNAREVTGFTPPIVLPDEEPDGREDLNFRTDRLAGMAFTWTNLLDEEIQATLKLCQEAERKWGARGLLRHCRPDLAGVPA